MGTNAKVDPFLLSVSLVLLLFVQYVITMCLASRSSDVEMEVLYSSKICCFRINAVCCEWWMVCANENWPW